MGVSKGEARTLMVRQAHRERARLMQLPERHTNTLPATAVVTVQSARSAVAVDGVGPVSGRLVADREFCKGLERVLDVLVLADGK